MVKYVSFFLILNFPFLIEKINKMPQLPVDCLNEIFEYLEDDKVTLQSCLLVNRFWCEISVRILRRNVWRFIYTHPIKNS